MITFHSRVALVLLLLSSSLSAEPLEEPRFRPARAGWQFEFPRDHGAHPEFRTEWWYFTGHLTVAGGRRAGFEVTFFRVGVDPAASSSPSAWHLRDIAIAHFAVTDLSRGEFRYYEKLNRASPYTAGAAVGRMDVFNEGWSARMEADGSIRLRAKEGDDAIDLRLTSRKPPAIHGENGVSVKAEGEGYASHYYSLTRLVVSGEASIGGVSGPVTGLAWLDREFGSAVLREYQAGWDWFSIQLEDDTELMLYVIRRRDGSADVTSSGSLVLADGRVIHLERGDFSIIPRGSWRSPHSGATYPMGWTVEVPRLGIRLEVRELMKEQELITESSTRITYWEGAAEVTGRSGSNPVRGRAYIEMTGYDKPFTLEGD